MPSDLDANPAMAIELCRAAHARLVAGVQHITDAQVRSASLAARVDGCARADASGA